MIYIQLRLSALILPARPVYQTGQTGPTLILATPPVRPVLTEPCPKFIYCKLQLLNSFFAYNRVLGEFKEETH